MHTPREKVYEDKNVKCFKGTKKRENLIGKNCISKWILPQILWIHEDSVLCPSSPTRITFLRN